MNYVRSLDIANARGRDLRHLVTIARARSHLVDGTSLGIWMAVVALEEAAYEERKDRR